MKILKAKQYHPEIKFKVLELPLEKIRIIPPLDWIKNRSKQFDYFKSFDNHGMIWPIVVTSYKPEWVKKRILPKNPQHQTLEGELYPSLYVHIGNKRVLYAKEKGYDRIEGYLVETKEDKNLIYKLQHIEHKDIPK
jgi:hypothetical protein